MPENVQGLYYHIICFDNFFHVYLHHLCHFYLCLETVLEDDRAGTVTVNQNDAAVNSQTTKNDIIRLVHLFKEPAAQRHWSDLNRILKRSELDARKTNGEYSEAANPLPCLAELFNDYHSF